MLKGRGHSERVRQGWFPEVSLFNERGVQGLTWGSMSRTTAGARAARLGHQDPGRGRCGQAVVAGLRQVRRARRAGAEGVVGRGAARRGWRGREPFATSQRQGPGRDCCAGGRTRMRGRASGEAALLTGAREKRGCHVRGLFWLRGRVQLRDLEKCREESARSTSQMEERRERYRGAIVSDRRLGNSGDKTQRKIKEKSPINLGSKLRREPNGKLPGVCPAETFNGGILPSRWRGYE